MCILETLAITGVMVTIIILVTNSTDTPIISMREEGKIPARFFLMMPLA